MQLNDIYELDVIYQVVMILSKQQKVYLVLYWPILNLIVTMIQMLMRAIEKIKEKSQRLKQSKESQNYFIGNGLVRVNMMDTYVLDHYLILEHGAIFTIRHS